MLSFFRAFELAINNVRASGWRSLLSVFTVLLGAAAISATLTLNTNVDQYIIKLMDQLGGSIIRVSLPEKLQLFWTQQDFKYFSSHKLITSFEPNYNIPSIVARYKDEVSTPQMIGVSIKQERSYLVEVKRGRFISDLDVTDSNNNIVISPKLASILKLPNPIGELITLRLEKIDYPARIIGIAKSPGEDSDESGTIWAGEGFLRSIKGSLAPSRIRITARSFDEMNRLEKSLIPYLQRNYQDNVRIFNPYQGLKSMRDQYKSLVFSGIALGILALFSGSVGIMNNMILSIRIRQREIGLYRSIGFSKQKILLIFTFETLVLCFAGGMAGATLGGWLGMIISSILVRPYESMSVIGIFLSIVITVLVGGIFGFFPANRASKLSPIEALRGNV